MQMTTTVRKPPPLAACTSATLLPGLLPGLQPARVRRSLRFHRCDAAAPGSPPSHDVLTKTSVARALAEVLGYRADALFAGQHGGGDCDDDSDSGSTGTGHGAAPASYLVPSDTLCSLDAARRLGVHGIHDLFGGVVPHPFVATKLITHPLWRSGAPAPDAWAHGLGAALGDAVLPGFSVFDAEDAWHAGNALLAIGPVRLKEAGGVGGSGQSVALDRRELADQIEDIGDALMSRGFVLECNLVDDVVVHSVGQVQVGRWTASYVGDQHTTRNHRGHEVYGGSSLLVARGGYDALLRLPLSAGERQAVAQALRYQQEAQDAYPAMFASRHNYDVAQGKDGHGRWRSGVLEQSWRIGGCSGAEVAALQAFKHEGVGVVRASTHEVYGDVEPPPGATVHYDGIDAGVGRLVKYVQVQR